MVKIRLLESSDRARRAGFSLVEVTMAFGIFTFVLVGLLGLMPTAMRAARESLDVAAALQLADKLAARLNAGDISSLEIGAPPRFYYFDDLGGEMAGPEDAVYKVGVSLGESESANLVRAAIRVQSAQGGDASRAFCYLLLNNE